MMSGLDIEKATGFMLPVARVVAQVEHAVNTRAGHIRKLEDAGYTMKAVY